MAYALVQAAKAHSSNVNATSLTVNFTAATAGNLLVAVFAPDKNAGTFGSVPSDWTLAAGPDSNTSISGVVYYKYAAGGETSVQASWSGTGSKPSGAVLEFSGVTGAIDIAQLFDSSANSDTSVGSLSMTSSASAAVAGELAIAAVMVDTVESPSADPTWDNSFTSASSNHGERAAAGGCAGLYTAWKTHTSGTVSTTLTWTTATDQAMGFLITFRETSASSDTITVDNASLALAGQDVATLDPVTDTITVDNAALTLTAQTVNTNDWVKYHTSVNLQSPGNAHNFTETNSAYRFEIRDGEQWSSDISGGSSAERSELSDGKRIPFNEELRMRYRWMMEPGSTQDGSWSIHGQIHHRNDDGESGGSPPWAIEMDNSDTWAIVGRTDPNAIRSSGTTSTFNVWVDSAPIVRGQWYDIEIRVKLDWNGNGYVKMWRDGVQIVNWTGAIGYNDSEGGYWKIGIYRSGTNTVTMATRWEDVEGIYPVYIDTEGTLALTGQNVATPADSTGATTDTITVDNASLQVTGQAVAVLDAEGIDPGLLVLAGQDVGTDASETIEAGELLLSGSDIALFDEAPSVRVRAIGGGTGPADPRFIAAEQARQAKERDLWQRIEDDLKGEGQPKKKAAPAPSQRSSKPLPVEPAPAVPAEPDFLDLLAEAMNADSKPVIITTTALPYYDPEEDAAALLLLS